MGHNAKDCGKKDAPVRGDFGEELLLLFGQTPRPRRPHARWSTCLQGVRRALITSALAAALVLGWVGGLALYDLLDRNQKNLNRTIAINMVVDRIIRAESNGDPNAKNKRSTASGAGQFLEGTWLDMLRIYRPDLASRGAKEALDLRWDPVISREVTLRFAERNAAMLRGRGLPVTPGTLYLSHFAGGAGAVAVLKAPPNSDAAAIMAGADSTGRTTREKIVKANPFLDKFTVADLKDWGDRKMRSYAAEKPGSSAWRGPDWDKVLSKK
jgi:hypothetical protein